MRIVYLAAGAGDMYCGACARDAVLIKGLIRAGHDVHMIPLYTPLKLEDEDLHPDPVFYGGINVFLQQASAFFRHLPNALDRFLDRPAFLKWVSSFAIEVDPKKLGPMTVSVLAGRDGRQRKEVDRLLAYLASQPRPDIINITNSLLSALAPVIKQRLKIPVVCTFQGEDIFVSELIEPYSSQARDLIRTHAHSVDLFVSPCQALAPSVADFLAITSEKLAVIRTAVDIPPPHTPPTEPFTLGYLSTIRPTKGLDILLEAARILLHDRRKRFRLLVAGKTPNKKYWDSLQPTIQKLGEMCEYLGEVDAAAKADFFRRCSLFALPSRYAEPRGVAALEAMAAGLPVLLPATGVFPELLELSKSNPESPNESAGILIPSHNPIDWANAIETLIDNPAKIPRMGAAAYHCMRAHCAPDLMIAQTLSAYQRILSVAPH